LQIKLTYSTQKGFRNIEVSGVRSNVVACSISISALNESAGDITSITLLGTTIVTLHTYEEAVALLDKKGRIYSSRPVLEMLNLCGWANHVVTMPYGRPLQECRRMIRTEINQAKVGQFHAYQEASVRRFLRLLLKTPENFYDLIEW